ncbi:hypothetical protein [Lysobacter sp. CA199]|uniref:hypothetical protein n=1 Tax=Lysobacter sp. CA199 TaxID=3455608 RepID=UPI003F8D60E4
MSAATRSHRILRRMAAYKGVAESAGECPQTRDMGALLGQYQNPVGQGDLWFFDYGLVWAGSNGSEEIRFDSILEVRLPNGKESLALNLICVDGREHVIPVGNSYGKFFDSLEMLRFFDRTIEDLAKPKSGG